MTKKITYWATTGLLSAMSLLAAFAYLSGNPEAAQGFAHVGYPQQLRVILGVAKPLGGIVLLVPGLKTLKEWAYAGFAFAWICATVAHTLAGDPAIERFAPPVLLILLAASYFTRDESRRLTESRLIDLPSLPTTQHY